MLAGRLAVRMSDSPSSDRRGFGLSLSAEPGPSHVVFFSGLMNHFTEAALEELCSPYGKIVGVQLVPAKGQAFIEFQSIEW